MNTYCGGDKSAMRTMVAAIERGEERDQELLERFGRMKAYLEKRDEQAGEWVYQVCFPRRLRRGHSILPFVWCRRDVR
jgi:L-amino acid N-acyltransferase YncA